MLQKHLTLLLAIPILLSGCSIFGRHDDKGRTLAPVRATSKPYKIKGKWYHPQAHYEYEEEGIASFYGGGDVFHGRPTATGERFDKNGITAAHKTLPLPCIAQVTNLENGRTIEVKVNDRGPFVGNRIIDLSRRCAQLLGFEKKGLAKVRVQALVGPSLAMNNLPAGEILMAPSEPQVFEEKDIMLLAEEEGTPPLEFATPITFDLEPVDDGAYAQATLPPPPSPEIIDVPEEVPHQVMSGIYVDVGSYTSHSAGHDVALPLAEITDVKVVELANGQFAVRMGPIASMADADRLVDHLENVGHDGSRIIMNR